MTEMPWWVGIASAVIGAAAVIWGVIATRRSHREDRFDKQATSALEGFAELVKALETRLQRSYEEIERAEKALGDCRGLLDQTRRIVLAFEHGGVIPQDEE